MSETQDYLKGMRAINSFYSMVYTAMRETMVGAQISTSGAYVWRGFRIDDYKGLANGQYYFQIYPEKPEILLMQESYIDADHQVSPIDKKHGVKSGSYYYPFTVTTDLLRTRFFQMSKEEQFEYLKLFVCHASEKALFWQNSDARTKDVKPPFLHGRKPRKIAVRIPGTFDQVGVEFLRAWKYQDHLFGKVLKPILESVPECEWARPNANVQNFAFRGLRMKRKTLPDTLRWSIYFDDPHLLKFQVHGGQHHVYTVVGHQFFDLPLAEQQQELKGFVASSIGITL
jgi:hypothetical protein